MKKITIIRISVISALIIGLVILSIIKWDVITDRLITSFGKTGTIKTIFKGLLNTLLITFCSFIAGIILGLITCLVLKINSNNAFILLLKDIFKIYINVFRGTPMMVQLLIINFIILASYKGDALFVAVFSFGLNSGAYVSEIIRGGIQAVPKGQMEAARSLGLSYSQAMVKIIFPQAIRNAFPSLSNEFVTLLKETSIVGFVASFDLTLAFKKIANASSDYATVYLIMGITYFVIAYLFTILFKFIERKIYKNGKSKQCIN